MLYIYLLYCFFCVTGTLCAIVWAVLQIIMISCEENYSYRARKNIIFAMIVMIICSTILLVAASLLIYVIYKELNLVTLIITLALDIFVLIHNSIKHKRYSDICRKIDKSK